MTLGTGVGGGIVSGGKVVRGAHGFGAEIGHFQVDPNGPLCACGERGHWEAVASGTALGVLGRTRAAAGDAPTLLARVNGDVDAITGVVVGDAAQAGEPDALAIVRDYAQQVAVGLVGLANILDPGGRPHLGRSGRARWRAPRSAARRGSTGTSRAPGTEPRSRSSLPQLGEEAGLVGGSGARRAPSTCDPARRLTLPSFREDLAPLVRGRAVRPRPPGLDAVFAYDHLFRRAADGTRRPALELLTVMGAVAAETNRIAVGSLVARATLRPPAVLANGFDTVARIAGPERLIAAIGAGDGQSREENESFGLDFGTVAERVAALRDAVDATRDHGYPVWVGGRDPVGA